MGRAVLWPQEKVKYKDEMTTFRKILQHLSADTVPGDEFLPVGYHPTLMCWRCGRPPERHGNPFHVHRFCLETHTEYGLLLDRWQLPFAPDSSALIADPSEPKWVTLPIDVEAIKTDQVNNDRLREEINNTSLSAKLKDIWCTLYESGRPRMAAGMWCWRCGREFHEHSRGDIRVAANHFGRNDDCPFPTDLHGVQMTHYAVKRPYARCHTLTVCRPYLTRAGKWSAHWSRVPVHPRVFKNFEGYAHAFRISTVTDLRRAPAEDLIDLMLALQPEK